MQVYLQPPLNHQVTHSHRSGCTAASVAVKPDMGVGRPEPSSRPDVIAGGTASHPDMLFGGAR